MECPAGSHPVYKCTQNRYFQQTPEFDAVQFTLDVVTLPQTPCKRLSYNYELKKADLSLLRDILSHVPWNIIEDTGNIEESWQLFKDLFMSAVNMSVPRVQWRRKKLKHWFSYQTIHLIRAKTATTLAY